MPETVVDNIRVHRVVYGLQLGLETKLDSVGLPRLVGVEPEDVRLAIKLLMGLRTAQPAAPSAATAAERVSDERLRNTRAWAWARVGQLSGADVIVAACDEALAARDLAQRGRKS